MRSPIDLQWFWYRLWLLLTFDARKREDWVKACGCSHRAKPLGWLATRCEEHWLD